MVLSFIEIIKMNDKTVVVDIKFNSYSLNLSKKYFIFV
ncbi:hypothetical protein LEP1GSC151_1070 [Leptospira interrogans serovar Grippotyphosa str. LT2186]|uniref:Uncharacterized protein n=1 Tax=Leptospira interrogans serovar Grippotyphosa str. LT2186 TaxID=1001599 RepID=M3I7I5_LEPIR|nr:hypothetical protein LEP1GSC097_3480 [Leptospira interrogans serovar Grippotyphosa str. UI 08368]EMG11832.1 hypothetical protein LEP1GSC151_1070 [Leptospira interrogans serovar Grippotyphosa str. LT2186]EMN67120.1 hypothetical protein LEP1GSC098_1604 [Leptospira interrogans serovar Grippotyphosa str. UI 08434]EMN85868.1 hypothetical protein LEP1GSC107_3084 [Leptospira interrogans serovar Grippotyphosa str. UI 12769]EMO94682.1 hypothetical protein LEP1GSC109_1334 [Leptospira interrogans str. 